jgi:methylated-DNA-[protein]-cysteine S-methyltransferase
MALAWRGKKVVATRLPDTSPEKLLADLRGALGEVAEGRNPPAFVRRLAGQIQAHLAGDPQQFPLSDCALDSISPFFRKVYECANRIPSGAVRTYGELAREAGSPKAARAVGQAMARDPFPLVVPCHRVLGGTQALVGFSAPGGLKTKSLLLEMESRFAARKSH